jgi:hypothetical protein
MAAGRVWRGAGARVRCGAARVAGGAAGLEAWGERPGTRRPGAEWAPREGRDQEIMPWCGGEGGAARSGEPAVRSIRLLIR